MAVKSYDPGDEAVAVKWNLLGLRQKLLLIKFSQSEILTESLGVKHN